MALEQTAGRGRSGHSWVSPPGRNLAISLLLRPKIQPSDAALLGMLASIAVAETIEALGVEQAQLKWPNDVLVQGRKIAGILPEASLNGRTVDYVILGLGLNVNSEQADFPADLQDLVTSILLSTGRKQDLEQTARLFLSETAKLYARISQEGCAFIPGLWETRWAHRDSFVIREGVRYKAKAISEDGSLVALTEAGELKRFMSGQIEAVSKIRKQR
jgi:BirA family transcriptional regulator, biotin operon repressor / biotin---[acetyl-CoA-carboxylase] ligase